MQGNTLNLHTPLTSGVRLKGQMLKLCKFLSIQVKLAMSNLLISNTRHMSKWSSIPEHFPYIALYFKPVYVELGYQKISAISKCFFIPEN